MNYRDFFKKNKAGKIFLPEGVNPEQLKMGIKTEKEHTKDVGIAAKIALDHLKEDPNYYTKLTQAGLEEERDDVGLTSLEPTTQDDGTPVRTKYDKEEYKQDSHDSRQKKRDQRFHGDALPAHAVDENLDSDEDSDGSGEESGEVEVDVDSEEGMPKVGGALAIPHVGQPIHMSKIIQVGGSSTGKSASGEVSGYSSVNKNSMHGGEPVKVTADNDKETITAGGKKVEGSVASDSVGGEVVSGEGQKQEGPNHNGSIAGTPKMKGMTNETLQRVLKESIRFDKPTGKWVLKEDVKGNSGKKVDMKMGPSYKVVQPTQCKTVESDVARTNQYEPEISETVVEEEEMSIMQERFQTLANAPRNLKESELAEMNKLKAKLESIKENNWIKGAVNPEHKGYCTPMTKSTCTPHRKALAKRFKSGDLNEIDANGTSYKTSPQTLSHVQNDDHARAVQNNPDLTETDELEKTLADLDQFKRQNPTQMHQRRALGQGGKLASPEDVDTHIGQKINKAGYSALDAIHRDLDAQKPAPEKEYDNTPYRGVQLRGDEADLDKLGDDEGEVSEAGGGTVQHRSFRTIDDAPQNPKARWDDEVDEGTEPKKSETVKQIEKSNKGTKKSKPLDNLKHKETSKTKSGIVLQKK